MSTNDCSVSAYKKKYKNHYKNKKQVILKPSKATSVQELVSLSALLIVKRLLWVLIWFKVIFKDDVCRVVDIWGPVFGWTHSWSQAALLAGVTFLTSAR